MTATLRRPRPPSLSPLGNLIQGYLPRQEPRQYLWDLVADYPSRSDDHLPARLCLAMTDTFGGCLQTAAYTAAALELSLDATLVQRDLSDGRSHRRGRPTLQRLYGLPLAINASATLGLVSLHPLLENFQVLDTGLALQIFELYLEGSDGVLEGFATEQRWRRLGIFEISDRDYLQMVFRETGLLRVLVPFRAGAAIAGGMAPITGECIDRFGFALGGALAILEDLEDLLRDDSACLRRGRRTLPLIQGFRRCDWSSRQRIRKLLSPSSKPPDRSQERWLLHRVASPPVLAASRELALSLLAMARAEHRRLVIGLPPSQGLAFLADLPEILRLRLDELCRRIRKQP